MVAGMIEPIRILRPRAVVALVAVSVCCSSEPAREPADLHSTAGFVDKVWTVAESPGGAGGMYVFLSDGTFVKAAKDAVPDVGKWSWNGKRLTIIESALPYEADIDSLTASYFHMTIHLMGQTYEVGLEPAVATMPDTTRVVEFDPARASIIANGNNPAWLFTVDNDRAMLRMGRTTYNFTNGEWVRDCAAVWDYSAHAIHDGREETIEMQLSTAMCMDSTSGAEYPLHVILVRGEKSYRGCAVAGKLQSSPSSESKK